MKRILSVVLGLVLLAMVGCDGGSDSSGPPAVASEEAVYDATGLWIMAIGEESVSGGCNSTGQPPRSDSQWIEQKGNRFWLGEQMMGSIDGTRYTYSQDWNANDLHFRETVAFTLDTATTGMGTLSIVVTQPGCNRCRCTYSYPIRMTKQGTASALEFLPGDIVDGGTIPIKYTCTNFGGDNISPALAWTNVPAGTRSFVLAICDADRGFYTHWLVYAIPGTETSIKEGIPLGMDVDTAYIAGGAKQLANGDGHLGYDGPCLLGTAHEFEFALYALDTTISGVSTEKELVEAIRGHILGIALMYAKN